MIEKLFCLCVNFLHWLAAKCGTTYEAVNIWIFCIIWPVLTMALVAIVILQRVKIHELAR